MSASSRLPLRAAVAKAGVGTLMTSSSPRALLTGCGAVSPLGCGAAALWDGLLAGRCGLGPIRRFDATGLSPALVGEVAGFDPVALLGAPDAKRLDRIGQYALAAAREALRDAGLDLAREDAGRVAVIAATTLGGMPIGEIYERDRQRGVEPAARALLHMPYAATAARLARRLGTRGPVVSPSIACASGTQAVGLALEMIRLGQADVVVAGGAEVLCHFVVSGFNALRATTASAVRPFDARRDGLAVGEGAAMLVIESAAHAQARGAPGAIEVAGSGLSSDAVHMTAPARDGAGAARAMRAALADAGLDASAVDFVSAHGTGTVYNDAMEMAALTTVLGPAAARVPVNGIKGAIGHTLGAAGAFEAILCARVLREQVIPPTVGCEALDPACGLDLVRDTARPATVRTALSTSSAFAGNNAAIVLRRT
jgi:3-oxoacyl-[acyl-carrier-protein] synthase II